MVAARISGGKFATRLSFEAADVFADGMDVVVELFCVICAVTVDFLNNRVFHNHDTILPSIPAECK